MYVYFDYKGANSKAYCCLIFFPRLFTVKNKAQNGYGNVYFNDAYCTGFGEQAIETKSGDQAFSSGNMCLKHTFSDSLAVKNSEDVAEPTNETLSSGI